MRAECFPPDNQCREIPKCGICETCNPSTGACAPGNLGLPCDDGSPCTADTRCAAVDIPGLGVLGLCVSPVPTVPSPTPTATVVASTSTPTPVPSGKPLSCIGDCDGDGTLADELLTGVRIILGAAPFAACLRLDVGHDDRIDVSELIRGINSLLQPCTPAALDRAPPAAPG